MSKIPTHISQYIRQCKFANTTAGHLVVMGALAVMLLGAAFGSHIASASAHAACASGDTTYAIQFGDTLSTIAQNNNTSTQQLASYNKIANANVIYAGQDICIPGNASKSVQTAPQTTTVTTAKTALSSASAPVAHGSSNVFPSGQCTWWANERYHQLHGIYVPWTTNSDAWQWADRARDFHWRVSSSPSVGSIIVIGAGVQGAWSAGHVGVVESVNGNKVNVSNMNWDGKSGVSYWTFTTGAGVSFVRS